MELEESTCLTSCSITKPQLLRQYGTDTDRNTDQLNKTESPEINPCTYEHLSKPLNITVIQVYAPTSNAEQAEVEYFYEGLQDLLELTCKKDVLFRVGDWNAKVGSQETPGVTGKFGLGVLNEAG